MHTFPEPAPSEPPPAKAPIESVSLARPEPEYDEVVTGYETFRSSEPFACWYGGVLPELAIAYETWGRPNAARDNTILLHTGLSASSHARSHEKNPRPGWWQDVVGPGKPIDTHRYHVVCTNVLGGCYGSTGPGATDPRTGIRYAMDFPLISVFDMVRAQLRLLDELGIRRLHASVGGSLGGMQSIALAAIAPERVARVVSISAAARSHPQSIAMRYVQRRAIMSDPAWNGGRYYGSSFPHLGQGLARAIGTISYRSGREWRERFGRSRVTGGGVGLGVDFEIESYLAHQAEKFCLQYDANSYLYVSKAMDLFDLTEPLPDGQPSPIGSLACPVLVVGASSDELFPIWQQRELHELIRCQAPNASSSFREIDTGYGHDAFLVEQRRLGVLLAEHLDVS